MKIQIDSEGDIREFDAANPIDISIPLRFNGPQPNAYGVEQATSEACEYGTLIGDTRRGGSCNFERYTFIPHCNGTHTECVGHITNERIAIRTCLQEAVIEARLITVRPTSAAETGEEYSMKPADTDRLITKALLSEVLNSRRSSSRSTAAALVIRTRPNGEGKLIQSYQGKNVPPYFTNDAMEFIVECGFAHLLVDLPSIDRLYDEGKLSNHRIFWNVEQGEFEANRRSRMNSTVTELIYVPNEVKDGEYLLNLQIASFDSDCAPSRPILFKAG